MKKFVHMVATEDPMDFDFEENSWFNFIVKRNRRMIWVGPCTQHHFLNAIGRFGAVFVGFAKEGQSNTQEFNCHKLGQFDAGYAMQLEDYKNNKDAPFLTGFFKAWMEYPKMRKNTLFYQHLLEDDERKSKMDLEYWIDYVQLFGVKEMIPLYDHMDPITYRNWDVYCLNFAILGCIILFWKTVLGFCYRKACGKKDKSD